MSSNAVVDAAAANDAGGSSSGMLPVEPGDTSPAHFHPYMNIFFDYYWNAAMAAAAAAAAYPPHQINNGCAPAAATNSGVAAVQYHQQQHQRMHHYHPYYRPQHADKRTSPSSASSSAAVSGSASMDDVRSPSQRHTNIGNSSKSVMPSLMDVNFLVAPSTGSNRDSVCVPSESGADRNSAYGSHLCEDTTSSGDMHTGGGSTGSGAGRSKTKAVVCSTHINQLFPEILAMIFQHLDVSDRGRAAKVCRAWRDASYTDRSVWRGVEARLQLRRANPTLFPSLERRGIRRIQVLSLRRSLKDVITGVPNLSSLNLSGCFNVTDVGLGHALNQDVPNLTELNLSLCKQVTDTTLGRIAQHLKNLERLDLAGCSVINDTGLLLLTWGLRKLRYLNLRSCRNVSDTGVSHLGGLSQQSQGEKCGRLEALGLQDCQKISDIGLKSIGEGLSHLRSLNLSFCASISDQGLKCLNQLNDLRELNLRSCDNISDVGVGYLCDGGSRLEKLDVSFCDKVGDPSLIHMSQQMAGIQELSLAVCGITDDGIERLVTGCRQLKTLHLGQCSKLTDRGLSLIAKHCPKLTSVDLYGCSQVTNCGLTQLEQMPRLTIVNLALWQKR